MNLPLFIAKRLGHKGDGTFSSIIHKIAIASIALGLAVMIMAFLILLGFQRTVKEKIYAFSSNIIITKYSLSRDFQEAPVNESDYPFLSDFTSVPEIRHIQPFAHKPGLIKTKEEVEGVILKGVDHRYDSVQFSTYMKQGSFINFDGEGAYSNDIVISQKIARRLKLEVGQEFIINFIQDPPRARRLRVKGIYDTGLEDFDDRMIIGDIRLIQRLNNWEADQVGGFEVFLNPNTNIDLVHEYLFDLVEYNLYVEKVSDKYIQIFDWLSLINNNIAIFLFLVLFVASFNMISIVLILIMERTHMIGLLKAMGAENKMIRRIFTYHGMSLIGKGLVIGNVVGVLLCWLQYKFQIIKLDPDSYYMSFVPIEWNWTVIFLLNILTFFVVALVLYIPTISIAKVDPIKTLRFN